ncbi:hypothetical protein BBJ28_00021891, partial [Nothophytophthora sp. Chile5]
MDPNAMSPWFTTPEAEYPPMNAPGSHPNSSGGPSSFQTPVSGSSGGLSGSLGSSNDYYGDGDDVDEFANEPPLLEGQCVCLAGYPHVVVRLTWFLYVAELGIHFEHIWAKTQSVLLPTKQINEHILDDADLAGPLVFCFLFGV